MKKKEALILLGLLIYKSRNVFTHDIQTLDEAGADVIESIYDYLESLDIPFNVAYDVLDEVYFRFYHNKWFSKSNELESNKLKDLMYSEFDYIEIDENGRVGIWCEVDGFIAWLDEYKKTWLLENKRKMLRDEKRSQREFQKRVKELLKNIEWEAPDISDCEDTSYGFAICISDFDDLIDASCKGNTEDE